MSTARNMADATIDEIGLLMGGLHDQGANPAPEQNGGQK
jgi:simple sugar transport system ATP-binding protein